MNPLGGYEPKSFTFVLRPVDQAYIVSKIGFQALIHAPGSHRNISREVFADSVVHIQEKYPQLSIEDAYWQVSNFVASVNASVHTTPGVPVYDCVLVRRAPNFVQSYVRVNTAQDAANVFRTLFPQGMESFYALWLDAQYDVIGAHAVASGSRSAAWIDTQNLVRGAVRSGAQFVIVGHNHPTDMPNPSDDDLSMTRNLAVMLTVVQVPLLDSMILSEKTPDYTCLAETHPDLFDTAEASRTLGIVK